MSPTNCSAPNEQNTTSKLSSANGSAVAVPSTAGTATPVSSSMRRECWSWRSDRSTPTPRPPWPRTQREHWPAPEPTSSTSLPLTSPRIARLVLGQPLRSPQEAGVAEVAAVGGLVLVGVPVPVGTVGRARLPLVDGPALDAHRTVVRRAHGPIVPDRPMATAQLTTLAPIAGLSVKKPSMPGAQERPELALEVAGGVRVGARAELQRQELVLHAEGERVDDQVEPVRVADHGGRLEQPALGVARDQQVLARADPVGVLRDLAEPGAGDQVGVRRRVTAST